jgi:hypothetical protein
MDLEKYWEFILSNPKVLFLSNLKGIIGYLLENNSKRKEEFDSFDLELM